MSLLEVAAQTLQIQDADGFDRFKNGFVVDNFTGHSIGDPGNVDYKVSLISGIYEVLVNREGGKIMQQNF